MAGAMSLGLFISITTRNQLLSSQIAMLGTFLPAFLLSGFAYAIANMPAAVQLITYLVPARYFISVARGIYLKGVGLEVLWPQAVFLSVFAATMLILSVKKFKKKVA
jgi:ABC-2 type transport system permease protein